MNEERKPCVLVVSGVKNSGKTTLITRVLPFLTERGVRTAVIKHDGHDFQADVPGTDSCRHFQAGAYGTAVFSDKKYMVVKRQEGTVPEALMGQFPEADLILLEGMKDSAYPKIEVVRRGNSDRMVCRKAVAAVASDLPRDKIEGVWESLRLLDLNDPKGVADFILKYMKTETKRPDA